jgi:hypothetical protein
VSGFNHSTETRLFLALAIIAGAILLPAWGRMHHGEAGYELSLAIAGGLATIATAYGTLSASDGWSLRTFFLYVPWAAFGAASCAVLATGILKSTSLGWQIGLGLVALLQLLAMLLPVIVWWVDRRQTES